MSIESIILSTRISAKNAEIGLPALIPINNAVQLCDAYEALRASFAHLQDFKRLADERCEMLQKKVEGLEKDMAYLRWRMIEIIPLFEEARDALPAINERSRVLYNISADLDDRMDAAGARTREQFDAMQKEQAGGT